ncbi:MAG: DUF371 domain-containing protein [Archaeoglobaceae archaeon]|nr:DUF371 domain-containing protein [Archaeoglobaceae archaeon]MCX8152129.1 DUF371 domain-containing protein [Archaeoglobaceae archaeon]MDW8013565.1 DUF371 domain-containing protein [Archaeoglobaceae archaeon]
MRSTDSFQFFRFFARGHENIRAEHRTTLEFTRDENLTSRGDCIVGVSASCSAFELPEWLKKHLLSEKPILVKIKLEDYGLEDNFRAFGSKKMSFLSKKDVVFRKSSFVCGRTVGINSTKAAKDLRRDIIELLKDRKTEITIDILSFTEF